jgi:hypothetical protein
MADTLVHFSGEVQCARGAQPLALTLTGRAGAARERATLAFCTATAPAELPATLRDALIECVAADRYRIVSDGQSWLLEARAAHLHFEVAGFYRAIPPRAVPLLKRLLFSTLLALAGSRAGLVLLRLLRR